MFQCVSNKVYFESHNLFLDVDECVEQSLCDPSATCTNTPGSYSCTCDEGYTGNGTTCSGKPNSLIYLPFSFILSFRIG